MRLSHFLAFPLFALFSLIYSDFSAVVDIFNAATGQWTTASLSAARSQLAAASLPAQNLAFFGGGEISSGRLMCAFAQCFVCCIDLMLTPISSLFHYMV